ncbi:hypothetical protein TrRE_jg9399 [Triparma retinervis]|uniref:Prolyl 4-hydroxylase alpha subunit domain-containing protein n=1 Tax=Triparma retinervis TaxID=2557542 RepID=A0A9W7ARS1_9STRA|nr:hypothetical protein TrRE_jg9399 [Triparma retinervis]
MHLKNTCDLTTLLEDSFSYISLHSPSLTFPSFVSLFTSLDLAFKVAGPDGSLSFHVNSYMVHDNDRNADLDGGVPGKLRVLYDCRDIVVSTQVGKGVRMAATPPRFETSELGSDPVITVPTPPSSYSAPFDYFLCRRYGELEMSARRWMAAMMWYRAGEYNALRSRAAGDGDARPGVDKHAQAACLRMMGEHWWARKCWEDGRLRYPSDQHIKVELDRIMAYSSTSGSAPAGVPTVPPAEAVRPNYIYLSSSPLLSASTCSSIIEKAEEHCLAHGWTTARHHAVPTTDVPVSSVPSLLPWFNGTLYPLLAAFVAGNFGAEGLVVHDAFVVKYDAREGSKGAVELPWHFDESTFSFTLALNEGFEGGGTEFRRGGIVNPGVGKIVGFRGDKCWHWP